MPRRRSSVDGDAKPVLWSAGPSSPSAPGGLYDGDDDGEGPARGRLRRSTWRSKPETESVPVLNAPPRCPESAAAMPAMPRSHSAIEGGGPLAGGPPPAPERPRVKLPEKIAIRRPPRLARPLK